MFLLFVSFVDCVSRTLANFLGWRVVLESAALLSDKWLRMARRVGQHLDGRPQMKPRWSLCVSAVKKYFAIGTSALYVSNLENSGQIELAQELLSQVMTSFQRIVKSNDWMDESTKTQAIVKTEMMKSYVGFPAELHNQSAVQVTTCHSANHYRWFLIWLGILRQNRHKPKILVFLWHSVSSEMASRYEILKVSNEKCEGEVSYESNVVIGFNSL